MREVHRGEERQQVMESPGYAAGTTDAATPDNPGTVWRRVAATDRQTIAGRDVCGPFETIPRKRADTAHLAAHGGPAGGGVPVMARRWNKNDSTAAGYGAHQRLAMLTSSKRYRLREKGQVPPLEYGTMKDAEAALT